MLEFVLLSPEGTSQQGRYWLGRDQLVYMWKHTGANNATFRTVVSARYCLPITEETFSAAEGNT